MPNDFFYPGIPTDRQNTSKRYYNNDNMPERTKLGVTVERPSLAALRDEALGPDPEALLAAARDTLTRTQPTLNKLNAAAAPVRDRASARAEQNARDAQTRELVQTGISAASMLPGPIGVAARAASVPMGIYEAAHGDVVGGAMDAAMPVFDIAKAAKGAALADRPSFQQLAQELHGPRKRFAGSGPQGGVPAVEHYWDALDLGFSPAKAAKSAGGSSKGSKAAIKSLQTAGEGARANIGRRATDYGMELAPGAEFGPVGRLGTEARATVADPGFAAHQTSSVGKGDPRGGGPMSFRQQAHTHLSPAEKVFDKLAATRPTAVHVGTQEALNEGDAPIELYNVVGGELHGSTVSADTLRAMGIPVPEKAVSSGHSLAALAGR